MTTLSRSGAGSGTGRSRVLADMECSGLGGGTGGTSRLLFSWGKPDEFLCALPGKSTVAWVLLLLAPRIASRALTLDRESRPERPMDESTIETEGEEERGRNGAAPSCIFFDGGAVNGWRAHHLSPQN